jgi:hypothetical protein
LLFLQCCIVPDSFEKYSKLLKSLRLIQASGNCETGPHHTLYSLSLIHRLFPPPHLSCKIHIFSISHVATREICQSKTGKPAFAGCGLLLKPRPRA